MFLFILFMYNIFSRSLFSNFLHPLYIDVNIQDSERNEY